MAEQAKIYPIAYFFSIENDSETGYACFFSVYELEDVTRTVARNEITGGNPSAQWKDVTSKIPNRGFTMHVREKTQVLIFVQLPTRKNSPTVFGSKKAVDVDVKSKLTNPVVQNCKTYPDDDGRHLLCCFEIDTDKAAAKVGLPKGEVERLPIMFDFVDTGDDVSPVFRGGHAHFGHGGIHPPTATTMIELIEDQTPQP